MGAALLRVDRRLVRCRGEGRCLCDDRGEDAILGTGLQRAGDDVDRRGRGGLLGSEPDGAGAHGARAVAVAAAEWAAEGPGVPGVSRTARRGWCAGAACQAPGPRGRFGHPRSPDGGGRAGAPAGRQRARCRAAGCRVGTRARPTPAVPGVGGMLPYTGACCSVRRPPALPSVCVAATAGGGRLPAGTVGLGRGICSPWSTTAASCCCRGSG